MKKKFFAMAAVAAIMTAPTPPVSEAAMEMPPAASDIAAENQSDKEALRNTVVDSAAASASIFSQPLMTPAVVEAHEAYSGEQDFSEKESVVVKGIVGKGKRDYTAMNEVQGKLWARYAAIRDATNQAVIKAGGKNGVIKNFVDESYDGDTYTIHVDVEVFGAEPDKLPSTEESKAALKQIYRQAEKMRAAVAFAAPFLAAEAEAPSHD